jgi:serine/threonine protein kinase
MSPEQARGQQVDKRSDIWSYGCVLYEMLTGRCAFSGETASDTIAAILTATPDWDLLPAATSPQLRRLLERCLEKDRTQRLRDIGEARVELDAIERAASGSPLASSAINRRPAVGANESVAVVAVNDRVDLDYLSDGIAEALTYRLTAIPGCGWLRGRWCCASPPGIRTLRPRRGS